MAKPRRFGTRLAALSSAAILAVYAVGYTVTEDAAHGATPAGPGAGNEGAQASPSSPSSAASATSSATAARTGTPSPTSTFAVQRPASTATASAAARPAAYRDGTYVGYATGRHGSLEATVTVAGGKIAAVQISQCLTRYPCTRIASLPGQVVSRQSAQVDYVSGATDSSRTFMQAVTNALASAS